MKLFLFLSLVLITGVSHAQSVQPALTAEPARNGSASRGSTSQAFKIDSEKGPPLQFSFKRVK